MLWCAFLMHGPAEETVENLENLKTDDSKVQFNCCVGLCICLHSGSACTLSHSITGCVHMCNMSP